jgi:hypothetical protein
MNVTWTDPLILSKPGDKNEEGRGGTVRFLSSCPPATSSSVRFVWQLVVCHKRQDVDLRLAAGIETGSPWRFALAKHGNSSKNMGCRVCLVVILQLGSSVVLMAFPVCGRSNWR